MSNWWQHAVCYQIYSRSYADSNGDGIGDLAGIAAHLDHLEWLGIDAIWLTPTYPSPNHDWGYDVADYFDVDGDLGTMSDLDALVAEAERRGIRVLMDLVPNHTSIEHEWFADSRSSRESEKRDWYVWADPKPGGSAPNNWVSTFIGPAWELDESTGQYYLHNFLVQQPDLNWWNPAISDEFDRILRFWFDRGVAGFRIDVSHMIIKDRELRDNPPATPKDNLLDQFRGQSPVWNSNRPEVHDVHKRFRRVADEYDPPRLLVGETFVGEVHRVAEYYGDNDELTMAFNIPFLQAEFDAGILCGLVEETEKLLPPGSVPVWTGSNHDVSRFPTRWAGGKEAAARVATMMLLTLRGAAFLYYGDELGMEDTDVPLDRLLDPVSIAFQPVLNRDAARTPMQWTGEPGAGFTRDGQEPWLPFGSLETNVEAQRADPTSTLHFTRDLIALKKKTTELQSGAYTTHQQRGSLWSYKRGGDVLVALNLGDEVATVNDVTGTIALCTNRERDGETARGALVLAPWEGAVVTT